MTVSTDRPLRILQVNGSLQGGGAERIARSLHEGLLERGHRSWVAVAAGGANEPEVLEIPNDTEWPAGRGARWLADRLDPLVGRVRGAWRVREALQATSPLRYALDDARGREYFSFPGTRKIPGLPPEPPDLLHLHNLHGGYFDLRELTSLSRRLPVVMTLHDEWTYTGHCAYSLGCERWRTGCGSCPDLTIYPALRRDGTRQNRDAKARIYARSRLAVSAPSGWLLARAQESILAPAVVDWRVIPNGVDRRVFRPGSRAEARAQLAIPPDPRMLLFVANAARSSRFKDYPTIVAAARAAAAVMDDPLMLVVLGEAGEAESYPNLVVEYHPYEADLERTAAFYRAADLFVHAAVSENFPTTILESLATGVPAVATAVGGIPEQVRSLASAPGAWDGESASEGSATGVLVRAADPRAMARAVVHLLADDELRARLAVNAVADARERFDLERQVDTVIAWYRDVVALRAGTS